MEITRITVAEFGTGHGEVGTDAQQLSDLTIPSLKCVKVKADLDNAGLIYVGANEQVTDEGGYELQGGEEVEIQIDRLDKVWVIASEADQGYSWLCI